TARSTWGTAASLKGSRAGSASAARVSSGVYNPPVPFAKVRDIQVYYEVQGQGRRLLYISGTGGDLRVKPTVFDGPLPQHFQVLSYDQRGLGQTDKPDIP